MERSVISSNSASALQHPCVVPRTDMFIVVELLEFGSVLEQRLPLQNLEQDKEAQVSSRYQQASHSHTKTSFHPDPRTSLQDKCNISAAEIHKRLRRDGVKHGR